MTSGRPNSVLVIEGDDVVRQWVAAVLDQHGCLVTAVATGRDGRDALAAGPSPSVIVLATGLPDMDVTDFLDWLPWTPHEATPVVLVVGSILGPDAAASERCAAVLTKPFSREELLTAVDGVLRPT